jgi:glycosyltransferase involved in cell wall biosynthesis
VKTRLKVSLVVLSYNQESYIREAVEGALSQNCEPLEIILSDDCSSDNTYSIIQSIAAEYTGPHTVIINKNEPNLGLINHVNKVFELASGDIIFLAAGDDICNETRVKDTLSIFEGHEEIMSVSMDIQNIDEKGELIKTGNPFKQGSFTYQQFERNIPMPINGCTRAYRRQVFDTFGLLEPSCGVEDATLVFRALLLGKIFHIKKIGVKYRRLGNTLSNSISTTEMEGKLEQRIKDGEIALNKGLLSKTEYTKLLNRRIRFNQRNMLLNGLNQSKFKVIYFLQRILPSNSFTYSEKKHLLKQRVKELLNR